ncbi:hypothetical protein SM033_00280 [Vibrio phage vB_VpaM_sm033]|nr:hypothetical protein SM033_00280 [Vibrio phage vB_VpaM_sm033]
MKTRLTFAIAAVLASTSAFAVDFSTTHTTGTTTTSVDINQQVTGKVNGLEFNYSQNRGAAAGGVNGNNCVGAVCDGTGNDTLSVGISIDATQTITKLDQLTTGLSVTTAENCDVTVAIGGISNSQGVRTSHTIGETETVNNNKTWITSGSIEVVTQTDAGYTGGHWSPSKLGNDFTVSIGGQTVSSEGDAVNVMALSTALLGDLTQVTVGGQDLAHADTNAMSVKIESSKIKVIDTSVSTTETESSSTTWYENN